MVGANCACGLFHPSNTPCSFSMFWGSTPQYNNMQPSPNNYQTTKPAASYQYDEPTENYYSSSDYDYATAAAAAATGSPPSSVDCTLSLGTPSTRLSNAGVDSGHGRSSNDHQQQHRPRRSVSNFCWDLLHPNKSSSKSSANGHNTSSSQPAGDPLVARRCANCDTTSTPLWRNGPRGPKSLCNACGIRYKKEERRAAANNSTNHHQQHASAAQATSGAGINMSIDANGYYGTTAASPWTAASAHHPSQKIQCFSHAAAAAAAMGNEFRLIEDHDTRDSFLSWRLNVMHG